MYKICVYILINKKMFDAVVVCIGASVCVVSSDSCSSSDDRPSSVATDDRLAFSRLVRASS